MKKLIRKVFKWMTGTDLDALDRVTQELQDKVADIDKFLGRMSETHVDVEVDYRTPWKVVMIGTYNKRDYVRIFPLPTEEYFKGMVHRLDEVSKHTTVGMIDCPVDMRGYFDTELYRLGRR